ncbi:MAG: DUF3781 domain-containing protein [Oscillospiraceae bacterium]|nr:DUF3781 domain-containing protein [Oscillospiraceae bacterium]
MNIKKILLAGLDKIHTTVLGTDRIRKNLNLDQIAVPDVVAYCKQIIRQPDCLVYQNGKNFYCETKNIRLTIHAGNFTIITAHKMKFKKNNRTANSPVGK